MKNKAFTIVELLMVITLMSVLLTLLLPAMSTAKEVSRSTVCSVNLRTMGQQVALYNNDYGGVMPADATHNTGCSAYATPFDYPMMPGFATIDNGAIVSFNTGGTSPNFTNRATWMAYLSWLYSGRGATYPIQQMVCPSQENFTNGTGTLSKTNPAGGSYGFSTYYAWPTPMRFDVIAFSTQAYAKDISVFSTVINAFNTSTNVLAGYDMLNCNGASVAGGPYQNNSGQPYWVKADNIQNPGHRALAFDSGSRPNSGATYTTWDSWNFNPFASRGSAAVYSNAGSCVGFRHAGQSHRLNVLCADNHVNSAAWEEVIQPTKGDTDLTGWNYMGSN